MMHDHKECTGATNSCSDNGDGESEIWCNTLFCTYRPASVNWNPPQCSYTTQPIDCGNGVTMEQRPPCVFKKTKDDGVCLGTILDSSSGSTKSCDPDGPNDYTSQDSVLWGNGVDPPSAPTAYRHATVHVILGLDDSAQGPVGGLSVYHHITSRKQLTYLDAPHNWMDLDFNGRKVLKNAIEYYSRPWAGDVDYSGSVTNDDYELVDAYIQAHGATQGCPEGIAPPNNYDVNNDGWVNGTDAAIISSVLFSYCGSVYPCTLPMKTCAAGTTDTGSKPLSNTDGSCTGTPPAACQPTCLSSCGTQ